MSHSFTDCASQGGFFNKLSDDNNLIGPVRDIYKYANRDYLRSYDSLNCIHFIPFLFRLSLCFSSGNGVKGCKYI